MDIYERILIDSQKTATQATRNLNGVSGALSAMAAIDVLAAVKMAHQHQQMAHTALTGTAIQQLPVMRPTVV